MHAHTHTHTHTHTLASKTEHFLSHPKVTSLHLETTGSYPLQRTNCHQRQGKNSKRRENFARKTYKQYNKISLRY